MIFLRLFTGSLMQIAPFAVLCIYPFYDNLKLSKKKTLVITAALIIALCSIFAIGTIMLTYYFPPGQELFSYSNLIFLGCLIPCFIYFCLLVREIWKKKFFIFAFSATSALVMTSICNIIETRLQLNKEFDNMPYYDSAIITIGVATAVILPLLILLLKYCYKPISAGLTKNESSYLALLSVALFLILSVGLSTMDYTGMYNPTAFYLFASLLFFVFLIYFVFFKLIAKTQEKYQIYIELKESKHQLELSSEQYKRISDNIENSRKVNHDIHHHIMTLQGLTKEGDLKAIDKYLEEYARETVKFKTPKLCDNVIINMISGYYQAVATKKDIAFSARIALPKTLNISDSDISILLGNLLENAIEATQNAPKENRFIKFNMLLSGKMLAITVDNSFSGDIKNEDNSYSSTKVNHMGVGLQSIKSIAEKYDGSVEFKNDETTFHSSVMIRL